ncbi:MAG TPA: hypothetical protein VN699_12035 [Pirellulales bacterium]|nr:hypothetical protein [Pirellulales bacterium]
MKKLSTVAVAFGLLAIGALGVRLLAGEAADEQPVVEFGGVKPRIIGGEDEASGDQAVLVLGGPAVAQAHRKQAQAMLDAAKAAYKTTQTDYDAGTAVFSDVCAWSRRWLEAELNLAKDRAAEVAVLQDHWKRMKRCYFRIRALNKTGTRGGETQKLHAAEFYVAEAELWLAAAGGAVPKKLDD